MYVSFKVSSNMVSNQKTNIYFSAHIAGHSFSTPSIISLILLPCCFLHPKLYQSVLDSLLFFHSAHSPPPPIFLSTTLRKSSVPRWTWKTFTSQLSQKWVTSALGRGTDVNNQWTFSWRSQIHQKLCMSLKAYKAALLRPMPKGSRNCCC